MTLAVVVATEPVEGAATGAPAATAELVYGDTERTVLLRLLDQLASLNVHDTYIITRPETAAALRKSDHRVDGDAGHRPRDARCPEVIESHDLAMDLREVARLAGAARGPMLILHGDLVMNDEQMARLVHDTKPPALALVAGRRPGAEPARPLLRTGGGHVVSAGSRHHQVTAPDAEFRGALRVGPGAAARLATIAAELADLTGTLPDVEPIRTPGAEPARSATPVTGDDAPALLLVGLVRAGVRVAARPIGDLVCDRTLTAGQVSAARVAVESADEDEIRLDAAVKNNDGLFTTYAVSTYSRHIARWAARRRLTPNMVTCMSMAVAVVAAVWFGAGTRTGMVLGGLLFYFAFVLDCVDGQLARYTRQFSTLGAWLDATLDRAKEYVVYAGLAVGSTAAAAGGSVHSGDVWALAAGALILQTVRHMIDFAFDTARARMPAVPAPRVPLGDQDDGALDPAPRPAGGSRRGGGLGRLAVWLSARTEGIGGLRWAKKVVILPIGERFALISVTAALFNARVTFLSLLVWGSLAAAYTLTGRVLRSVAR